MEKLPLGKPLSLRITKSPAGALVFAISDPATHTRLFTGSAVKLAELYPTPELKKHDVGVTATKIKDVFPSKDTEPIPEAASQA